MDKHPSDPISGGLLARFLYRLFRLFFYLLYYPLAWTYDYVAAIVSFGRWNDWIFTILPHLEQEGRYLELGHGPGHLQLAGRARGLRMAGLDASFNMCRIAYLRLQKNGFQPQLYNGYAQSLPFAPGSFQRVVATFPTEYIADPQTLAEIKRVLASHGSLLIIPAAWIEGTSLPDRFLARLFQITRQAPDPADPDPLQPLQTLLEESGFLVQISKITLESSSVLLIEARKSG
ncbi:MAG: class I SAM-dependent methyltransferase [Anaerolineales bacterium]|nr:class I SAM-dependent methyltransferase [Anaerolineales bacterium]